MSKPIVPLAIASILLGGALTSPSDSPIREASDTTRPSPLSPNPSSYYNELNGVSARSGTDAWAVGYYNDDVTGMTSSTLILHWDGTNWSQVPSPNPSLTYNQLYAVSARSGTDAWAVGSHTDDATATSSTLILHWDGASWSQVPSPNRGSLGVLYGVSARSGRDAWAVGVGTGSNDPLILHWDGTSWSRLNSPDVRGLFRVSAGSATDAWAVANNGVVLHWDGSRWSKVRSHSPRTNFVWDVTTESATDAWVIGSYWNAADHVDTLILHWDGVRWSQVHHPTAGRALKGVSSAGPRNAWGVGTSGRLRQRMSLIYHWDGRRWSRVDSPNPSSTINDLLDVSARSAKDAWAVGSYFDESTGVDSVLILHWDGTSWAQQ